MYRTQSIILQKQIIRDNKIRISLFSKEFWKVSAWWTSAEFGDIGSIVEVLIDRKNWQNHIKKMEVIEHPSLFWWSYEHIFAYLELIAILYTSLPDGVDQWNLYWEIASFLKTLNKDIGKVWNIIIMQARVLKYLWYLNPERYHINTIYKNLYLHAFSSSMKSMFIYLSENNIDPLFIKETILEARHTYSYKN